MKEMVQLFIREVFMIYYVLGFLFGLFVDVCFLQRDLLLIKKKELGNEKKQKSKKDKKSKEAFQKSKTNFIFCKKSI